MLFRSLVNAIARRPAPGDQGCAQRTHVAHQPAAIAAGGRASSAVSVALFSHGGIISIRSTITVISRSFSGLPSGSS